VSTVARTDAGDEVVSPRTLDSSVVTGLNEWSPLETARPPRSRDRAEFVAHWV
jgi:hypothetical protein